MQIDTGLIIGVVLGVAGIIVSIFYSAKRKTFKNNLNPKKVKNSVIINQGVHVGDKALENTKEK